MKCNRFFHFISFSYLNLSCWCAFLLFWCCRFCRCFRCCWRLWFTRNSWFNRWRWLCWLFSSDKEYEEGSWNTKDRHGAISRAGGVLAVLKRYGCRYGDDARPWKKEQPAPYTASVFTYACGRAGRHTVLWYARTYA